MLDSFATGPSHRRVLLAARRGSFRYGQSGARSLHTRLASLQLVVAQSRQVGTADANQSYGICPACCASVWSLYWAMWDRVAWSRSGHSFVSRGFERGVPDGHGHRVVRSAADRGSARSGSASGVFAICRKTSGRSGHRSLDGRGLGAPTEAAWFVRSISKPPRQQFAQPAGCMRAPGQRWHQRRHRRGAWPSDRLFGTPKKTSPF